MADLLNSDQARKVFNAVQEKRVALEREFNRQRGDEDWPVGRWGWMSDNGTQPPLTEILRSLEGQRQQIEQIEHNIASMTKKLGPLWSLHISTDYGDIQMVSDRIRAIAEQFNLEISE